MFSSLSLLHLTLVRAALVIRNLNQGNHIRTHNALNHRYYSRQMANLPSSHCLRSLKRTTCSLIRRWPFFRNQSPTPTQWHLSYLLSGLREHRFVSLKKRGAAVTARMPSITITTTNSIRVNPECFFILFSQQVKGKKVNNCTLFCCGNKYSIDKRVSIIERCKIKR